LQVAHSVGSFLLAKYVERLLSQKDAANSDYPPAPGTS
jgi:hypothetical protein